MKEVFGIIKKVDSDSYVVLNAVTHEDVTNLFRPDMIVTALTNGQALKYNNETMRAKRIDVSELPAEAVTTLDEQPVIAEQESVMDPVMSLIHNASKIKPADLEIADLKWKYLVRSAVRGKNIMMVGPAGCGKTHAAKALPEATGRPFFYFNLGATQDPRATLIGNTHFINSQTKFDESAFVKAIQTENAVILLDELSRAHPEAWNILMTRFEVIEVDILSKDNEIKLLTNRFGDKVSASAIASVADIASITRDEWKNDDGKLSTMISTRMTVRICELLADQFTLEEAAEVAIIPFFDASGGIDSERTFVKQVIQKHLATPQEDIFNTKK